MNGVDLILIAVIVLALGLAARRVWKTRKTGGCGFERRITVLPPLVESFLGRASV